MHGACVCACMQCCCALADLYVIVCVIIVFRGVANPDVGPGGLTDDVTFTQFYRINLQRYDAANQVIPPVAANAINAPFFDTAAAIGDPQVQNNNQIVDYENRTWTPIRAPTATDYVGLDNADAISALFYTAAGSPAGNDFDGANGFTRMVRFLAERAGYDRAMGGNYTFQPARVRELYKNLTSDTPMLVRHAIEMSYYWLNMTEDRFVQPHAAGDAAAAGHQFTWAHVQELQNGNPIAQGDMRDRAYDYLFGWGYGGCQQRDRHTCRVPANVAAYNAGDHMELVGLRTITAVMSSGILAAPGDETGSLLVVSLCMLVDAGLACCLFSTLMMH